MSIQFKTITHLNEDQRDALGEIVNIGMGQAGDSLARLLDTFVNLSIPRVRLVSAAELPEVLKELVGTASEVYAVRQPFHNHLQGEAIIIYDRHGCNDLADLMGHEGQTLTPEAEDELLLDIGNILAAASLNGIAEQLKVEITFLPPSILARKSSVEKLFSVSGLSWSHALLIEVNYTLEERRFKSHLLMMLTEDSIDTLRQDVDRFLGD